MSSYLADRISLDYTGFFFERKENFFSCVTNERSPERVLLKSLAR